MLPEWSECLQQALRCRRQCRGSPGASFPKRSVPETREAWRWKARAGWVGGVQGRVALDADFIMLGRVQNPHIWHWHPPMCLCSAGKGSSPGLTGGFPPGTKTFSIASSDLHSSVSRREAKYLVCLFIPSLGTQTPKDCPVTERVLLCQPGTVTITEVVSGQT